MRKEGTSKKSKNRRRVVTEQEVIEEVCLVAELLDGPSQQLT